MSVLSVFGLIAVDQEDPFQRRLEEASRNFLSCIEVGDLEQIEAQIAGAVGLRPLCFSFKVLHTALSSMQCVSPSRKFVVGDNLAFHACVSAQALGKELSFSNQVSLVARMTLALLTAHLPECDLALIQFKMTMEDRGFPSIHDPNCFSRCVLL